MTRDRLQIRLRNWLMRKTASSAVRRVGEFPIAVGTDIGNVREENQDRVAVLKTQIPGKNFCIIIALADGMGGMRAGAECASIAISSFFSSCIKHSSIELNARLTKAAHDANDAVYSSFRGEGGATLSALIFESNKGLASVNVGDSRIYGLNDSVIRQLTTDDTIAAQFQKEGDRSNHYRNELLQYIGVGEGLEPHVVSLPTTYEQYLITSDGLHYVDQTVLRMVADHAGEPGLTAKRLTEIAKWCGGHDNGSVAIFSPNSLREYSGDNSESDLVFVWDPYGELQIFNPENDKCEYNKSDSISPPASVPQNANAKKQGVSRKKKTRQSARAAEPVDETAQSPRDVAERPQLKIDFINETDGKHGT